MCLGTSVQNWFPGRCQYCGIDNKNTVSQFSLVRYYSLGVRKPALSAKKADNGAGACSVRCRPANGWDRCTCSPCGPEALPHLLQTAARHDSTSDSESPIYIITGDRPRLPTDREDRSPNGNFCSCFILKSRALCM